MSSINLGKRKKRSPKKIPSSNLERKFETLWKQIGLGELEKEYQFFPARRWRFDFALPAHMIAIEIEGGTRGKGRHTSHDGYKKDCEKYNFAAREGWCVIRLTSDMITPEWIEFILWTINRPR